MCQATDALRGWLGIHEYTPGTSGLPRALVRKPTRYGERGRNGHAPDLLDMRLPAASLIDHLAQQHRSIRQILADRARRMGGS